jgi:hypothetical protein
MAKTRVINDDKGSRLVVDGEDFMVFGMNWGYMPIGHNYNYDFWGQPEDVIQQGLAREMPMLKAMGVNAIRHYVGIPPKWVEYIYDNWGIYTMVNHPCARYGITVDGTWIPNVDYADPTIRAQVMEEVVAVVKEFEGTRGLLMWLLGNENNYGLHWTSFEIEALPESEHDAARARPLYSMYSEIIDAIHELDDQHPVAISNGDIQYLDIIAEECPNLDIYGTNVYRGISVRDMNLQVKLKLGTPLVYTEFGADAYNAKELREDQPMQARYLIGQWKEIYERSYGKGGIGNAIGGFVFQWSDGWWKFGQDSRLDIHDTNASWPADAYPDDFVEGQNNMNEEWWGICAKGYADDRTLYEVYPRAAYYALQEAFSLDPYDPATDRPAIERHFGAIDPYVMALKARSDRASLTGETQAKIRVSQIRMEFETYNTGGNKISTPAATAPQDDFPAYLGFDNLQSFYADIEAKPIESVVGKVSVNILGRVPVNPIDEIFYENRGRPQTLITDQGPDVRIEDIERLKIYQASLSWDDPWFQLEAFYRTGHTHWGYEGDFFSLYRDAFYGDAIDIYNAPTPIGVELKGKKTFDGFKLAFGPEVHWGANPSLLLKYSRNVKGVDATAIYQDEFSQQTDITTTNVIPTPKTRRATVHAKRQQGRFTLEAGGIWSGYQLVDREFRLVEELPGGGYKVLLDKVKNSDTFGFKAKVTYEKDRWHWYGQTAYGGIVTYAGPQFIQNFTNWHLQDTGLGNGTNVITGLAVNVGNFQIGPNIMYQKPLVGPIPGDAPANGSPRNILDDPFVVRGNREMAAGELVLSYDPHPATWFWQWDNDIQERARYAGALGFIFRSYKTTQDASIGFLANGDAFAFPGAPPPRDMWEMWYRMVSRIGHDTRIVANLYGGNGEARGDDPRLIQRYGGTARVAWRTLALESALRFNDWGPYDYHRDFNLTYPVQVMADLSRTLGKPRWFGFAQTKFGARATWRSLDKFSPRYCPGLVPDASGNLECDADLPGSDGSEWEIRTYLHFAM